MIQSLLKVGWVGLGCPFPGACRIPKNSSQFPTRPLSLYCPKLVTLYYVTFYEMEQLCRSTSYRGSSHWTREEKNFSLSNYSQLLPLSNRRPLRNSQKFNMRHRNYLATVYVISRFNATQQEWNFFRIEFEVTS